MASPAAAFARLAGISKAVERLLDDEFARRGELPIQNYEVETVGHYFEGAVAATQTLRDTLPDLYRDFQDVGAKPTVEMAEGHHPPRFSRHQLERLLRDISQIFEIRSYSEITTPAPAEPAQRNRIFISHGRADDWRAVQAYIEKDIGLQTVELAQQPNLGRTILAKLVEVSMDCNAAVIVMTGDDQDAEGLARARENVLHEIGFFQAKYGLARVCLLHEEGVNIPSNIHGLVYTPFTKGKIEATFGFLHRELKAMYAR